MVTAGVARCYHDGFNNDTELRPCHVQERCQAIVHQAILKPRRRKLRPIIFDLNLQIAQEHNHTAR